MERQLKPIRPGLRLHRAHPRDFRKMSNAGPVARMGGTPASFREQAVLAKNREKPQAEAIARKAKLDVLAVPASIVAIQNLDPNPFRAEEDYAAVTMAVYNMTLVAHARHLGTYWHTGPLVYFEPFRAWLDLNPQQRIIAYLFVGYPARTPHPERIAGNERTRWLS